MDTISTTFNNSIDFWMSFGLGVMGGIAVVSIIQTARDLVRKARELRRRRREEAGSAAIRENVWDTPPGRGDFSPRIAVLLYCLCALVVIKVCQMLVPAFPLYFLFCFTFLYTPLLSYLNARLIGICGQHVAIPFVREAAFILSGYKGVEIWLAPIPVDEMGSGASGFRTNELTGTNFWSYVKASGLIIPLSFILSLVFWGFIWKSGAIPSEMYPFAQKMWDLRAKQTVLMYSATLDMEGAKPLFFEALHPEVMAGSFSFTLVAFAVMSALHIPIMAIYGFVQTVGGMPHAFVSIVIGALVGKFYFNRRFGQKRVLQVVPVLLAGYGTGVGLIALLGVAINLIVSAVSALPF